jgi:hypothetical protein
MDGSGRTEPLLIISTGRKNIPQTKSTVASQKRGIIMAVTVKRVAITAALSFAVIAAFAAGVPDGVVAALPMIDAGPDSSVIWD